MANAKSQGACLQQLSGVLTYFCRGSFHQQLRTIAGDSSVGDIAVLHGMIRRRLMVGPLSAGRKLRNTSVLLDRRYVTRPAPERSGRHGRAYVSGGDFGGIPRPRSRTADDFFPD